MPTLALLLFYLILPAHNTQLCVLWLNRPAISADVAAACGPVDMEQDIVNFVAIYDGKTYCSTGASAIYAPDQACNLPGTLDQYRMVIVSPAAELLLCAVKSASETPTRKEVAAACDAPALHSYDSGAAILRLIGPVEPDAAPVNQCAAISPEIGPGLYDQPADAEQLTSADSLTWLAGRLIWHGLVTPACDGFSGLDPLTLAANPCGMTSAAQLVARWQNQFNTEIFAAARAEGVPARVLKRIISVESQFWPLWDARPAGETGLAQVTTDGADQYLRWYTPDYDHGTQAQRAEDRAVLLNTIRCDGCEINAAIQKERENIIIYARILRAYRCASASWRAALVRWNGETYTRKVEGE